MMAYEIAAAMILVAFIGILGFFYMIFQAKNDHAFLQIIFFMLSFPAISGASYYALTLARDNFASSTQISILQTFYWFTMTLLIIMYSYFGLRVLLWGLSYYKNTKRQPWEENNEIV